MLHRPLIALLCLFVSAGSALAIEKSVRTPDESELLDAAKSGDEGASDEEEAQPEPVATPKRAVKRSAAPVGEEVAIDAEPSTMRQAEELVEGAAEAPVTKPAKTEPTEDTEATEPAATEDEAKTLATAAKAKAAKAKKDKAARQAGARRAAAIFDEPGAPEAFEDAPLKKKVKTTQKPVSPSALEEHGDGSVGAIALPAAKKVEKVAEPEPAPKNDPASVRGRAFMSPIAFTSKGQIKAFMIKINRDLHYTFNPVIEGGVVTAMDLQMVDRANDDKVTEGVVHITPEGVLTTDEKTLTNACNLALIDPATHAKLRIEEGPFETRGIMEVQGNILQLTVKHRRIGAANADGSMTVESSSDSDCDKVHTRTVTELAADGLPTSAETTGTIAKGPINLNVNLKLQRESGVASVE